MILARYSAGPLLAAVLLTVSAVPLVAADSARTLSGKEVKALLATATTPAQHQRLAAHFHAKAEQLKQDSKEHTALAEQYEKNPTGHEQKHPMSGETAAHCRHFAEATLKASAAADSLAAAHAAMAKGAKP